MTAQTLEERLQEPDVVDLPDWQAAEILNQPDTTLPVVVSWLPTETGIGTILDVLGPVEGATLLDNLDASPDPVIKWGLDVLRASKLDVSKASTQGVLQQMQVQGAITSAQYDSILSLSRKERFPSWAEWANIQVDARAVGLARGGVA